MNSPRTLRFDNNFHLLAEIGVNHEGEISTAKKMIEEAKSAGCHSVKLQAYKAEKLVTREAAAYWDTSKEETKSQIELFRKYDRFGISDYEDLSDFAHSIDLQFGLSIFNLDWIEPLSEFVDYFKIASGDITCTPLLEKISRFKKPIILSTGAATFKEIKVAVDTLTQNGNRDVTLLHCILNYPTDLVDSNLKILTNLRLIFPDLRIGLSDHVAKVEFVRFAIARALGASVIEKHFTSDKKLQGNDHYHSGSTEDFANILSIVQQTDLLMGSGEEIMECEIPARQGARRSIVYSKDLAIGEVIEFEHLLFKRPGIGLSPTQYSSVVGKTLFRNVSTDQLVQLSDFT
jgi:N-acetylneuraminate synthase